MRLSRQPSFVRPLVRYVDQEQAVIEVQVALTPTLPEPPTPRREHYNLLIEMRGSDGFIDEQRVPVHLKQRQGAVRFDMVQPQRWWPAGMGEQVLYELSVTLLNGDDCVDDHQTIIGLTSVRPGERGRDAAALIVNGELCAIESVVSVDRSDESRMLPAAGNSLLVVRDHYGTDLLYDAADRAGILMVQCVPIHPQGAPEQDVAIEVSRLAGHPSLAGWYVGHLGELTERIAQTIRTLDPTHSIFHQMPGEAA